MYTFTIQYKKWAGTAFAPLLVGLLATVGGIAQAGSAHTLTSPDGQIKLVFALADFEGQKSVPVYQVHYKGRPIMRDSRLGLEWAGTTWRDGLTEAHQATTRNDSTWKPVYGERDQYRDHYEQLTVDLKENAPPHRQWSIVFRAYNEGVAFHYVQPQQAGQSEVTIDRELTEFRWNSDPWAWTVYTAQGKYAKVKLSEIKTNCERPLVLEMNDGTCAALGEARLVDFARMKFSPRTGLANAVVATLAGPVQSALPLTTPWRFIMLADSPGKLLENNGFLLNLNDPCALADTSWIRPGKVIREVTLTTVGGKACVDFAVQRHLQYVEFDAGWYGNEYSDDSDARGVNVDPKRSKGPLDLHEVIRYAQSKNVGIILYVNRRALERQMDEIFPLYQKWGVKGVKFGFVNVGSQQWTRWVHEGVRKAAQYKLMVDIHDEYRTTGYTRTYPNLMTVEGIAGDETSPSNTQTLSILFTRMLAGSADNTVCYYDRRVTVNATHAYQLAKPVCLYSPWQFLYWYDRPPNAPQKVGGAGNAETRIGEDPELEFYDQMPTVWDETRVLHGKIGEYALLARRTGKAWFLGYLNSGQERTLAVPLNFLAAGEKYVAHIYADDPSLSTRTQVSIKRFTVTSQTTMACQAGAQGGLAVRLTPASPQDHDPDYP